MSKPHLVLAVLGAVTVHPPATAQNGGPAPVVVAEVQRMVARTTRLFVGDVRPSREVMVAADVEGRVAAFPADEGQRVEAGAVLAQLRTTTTELELEAARATARALAARLEQLRNGPRAQEIAQARARLAVAEAELTYRRWALENAEELLGSGTSSEDEVREARRQAMRAQGVHAEADEALALLLAGTRQEELAQAEAEVAAQAARVARLEDDLERLAVRAPFTGYVIAEATEAGAWLARGTPVARIAALDRVEVVLPVPERDVGTIAVGAEVAVEVPALPGRTFDGRILAITPSADLRARTIPVRIAVENVITDGQPLIKAGMFAQARLPIGTPIEALVVPPDALVLGGPVPTVHVVERSDDGTPTVRPLAVRSRTIDGARIAVEAEGLREGDLVVVEGNERLRPGQPVQITGRRD